MLNSGKADLYRKEVMQSFQAINKAVQYILNSFVKKITLKLEILSTLVIITIQNLFVKKKWSKKMNYKKRN